VVKLLASIFVILTLQPSFIAGQEVSSRPNNIEKKSNASVPVNSGNSKTVDAIVRTDFFPIEKLSTPSRKLSEDLLLAALDSEALYTIVGQIKPVSEGFWGTYFPMESGDLSEIEKVREAVKLWSIGGFFAADVLIYEKQQSGRRHASLYLAHVPTLQATISRNPKFFDRFGLTDATNVGEGLALPLGTPNMQSTSLLGPDYTSGKRASSSTGTFVIFQPLKASKVALSMQYPRSVRCVPKTRNCFSVLNLS